MAFPWSPTGYHLDRLAFYIVADTLRLYADGDIGQGEAGAAAPV